VTEVKAWKKNSAANNDPPPAGWPENMNRSDVNNSAREMMGAIRRWYDDPGLVSPFEDYTVTRDSDYVLRVAAIDATGILPDDRRIWVEGTSTDEWGFVASTVFSSPDTLVTVEMDGGVTLPAGADHVEMSCGAMKRAAYRMPFDSGDAQTPTSKLVSISGFDDIATAYNFLTQDEAPAFFGGKYVPIVTETANSVGNADWEPADWLGVPIPDADGALLFRVSVIGFLEYGVDVDFVTIRIGPLGSQSDPKFCQNDDIKTVIGNQGVFSWDNAANEAGFYMTTVVQPEAGDKVTITFNNDTSGTLRKILIAGTAGTPQKSILTIERLWAEA